MTDNSKQNRKQQHQRRHNHRGGGGGGGKKSIVDGDNNNNNSSSSKTMKEGGEVVNVADYKAHHSILIQFDEENPTWYDYGTKLAGRNDTILSHPPPNSYNNSNANLVSKYRAIGDMIYQKEIQLFGRKRNGSNTADERWVENTMKKGTLKDRIAAMSVTVSTDPIHKFYSLEGLLSMVGCNSESGGKTNSRVAQLTSEALDDLFINTFLPPNRKLLTLAQRPLYRYEYNNNHNSDNQKKKKNKTKHMLSPRILLLWRFEEMIKEKYDSYLRKYMVQTLHDGADMHKIATLKSAAILLSSVPEGESQVLAMIANKLGDPSKKVASSAGYQLRNVLHQHPNMKIVITREVQQLAHRPHLSPKALYNCIVFLNQIKLDRNDDDDDEDGKTTNKSNLPASLVKTYFRLFEVAVKKNKSSMDPESEEAGMKSRLLSALLTGVNRAHPYLPEKDKDMEHHIDALYRVVHTAAPAACTQALMLLFHLSVGSKQHHDDDDDDGEEEIAASHDKSDSKIGRQKRFYRALYATLSRPEMISHGKHLTMYFNLLYKAMKFDPDSNRVNAFSKRLMCTVLHSNSAPIAGCLFLLNEISKTHDGLRTCIESVPDEYNAGLMIDETKREPSAAIVSTKQNGDDDEDDASGEEVTTVRNPPCWELSMISHHFHPSVAKFSDTIGNIEFSGDPLKDFALVPFLDKFAYRNPKSKTNLNYRRGKSVAERRSGTDRMVQHRLELPVNDPSFLEQEDVNEQDEFFHTFFMERARRDEIKGIQRGKKATTEEEDEAAEDEALDAAEEAEGLDDGGKSFEEYERTWETDSEEEAFVDSLAVKLLEDAADGAAADLDEDPDMEDWGDLNASDDDDNDDDIEIGEDDDDDEKVDIDDDQSDESDDSNSEDGAIAAGKDDDDFMDAAGGSDSSDDDDDRSKDGDMEVIEEDAIIFGKVDKDESDDDDDDDEEDSDDDNFGLIDDDDDDSDNDMGMEKLKDAPAFADAEDYEELVNKSFNELKRESPSPENETPKKKKRKKGKKKG